jgi:DNA-directed RNA polymerase subunit beta
MALDNQATEKLRAERAEEGEKLRPDEVVGMSAEDILAYFYDTVAYTAAKGGWKTGFDTERMRAVKLNFDLIDAKTGKAVAKAGDKSTPRTARRLADGGLKEILVPADDLIGHYVSTPGGDQ